MFFHSSEGMVVKFQLTGVLPSAVISASSLTKRFWLSGAALKGMAKPMPASPLGMAPSPPVMAWQGGLVGDAPVHEVEGGLDVLLAGVLVDAPVVLGAGAEALVGLVAHAEVDGDHGDVVVGELALAGDVGELPGAVLIEHGLAADELVDGVGGGLHGELARVAGGVVDVEIPDGAVVVKVGALDGVGGGNAVILILEVDGQVGEVGLEAPVGAALHAGGGEGGEAQLVLAGGDVLGDGLQLVEGLDVVDGVAGLLEQGLVDDDAVGLDDVGDAERPRRPP